MKKYVTDQFMFLKLPHSDILEKNNLAGYTRAVKLIEGSPAIASTVEVQTTPNWNINAPTITVQPIDVGFHFDSTKKKWFYYDTGREASGVFCFWEWDEKKRKYSLVESFGVNNDGRPVGETIHASDDRDCTSGWMNKKSNDGNYEEVMGRAVTSWSVEEGVSLIRWTPPKRESWMGVEFTKLIKKKYTSFLEDGHTLYFGTAREVERIIGI